jgi:hypothetical protein
MKTLIVLRALIAALRRPASAEKIGAGCTAISAPIPIPFIVTGGICGHDGQGSICGRDDIIRTHPRGSVGIPTI